MEEKTTNKNQSRLVLVITLLLAAGGLFLALRGVNWTELGATFARGDLRLLALGVLLLSISCMVRGLRWRVLLSAEKVLPPLTVFWATMLGYLGNAYLPARAGEVARSVVIGEKGSISKTFSLATALTERVVDAVILVAVSAVALTGMGVLSPELEQGMRAMSIVGAIGIVGILAAPRLGGLVNWIVARLPVSPKLREKLGGIAGSFLTGAGALQHWGRLAQFLLYSAAIWSLDTLCGLSVARAFGLGLTAPQVFVLLAAIGIASAIPSTPGYVGVYQLVAVAVLVPFGLSQAEALAYIIAYQGVMYVVITFWGMIGLWQLREVFGLLIQSLFRKKSPAVK